MKYFATLIMVMLVSACASPNFVSDASPVPVTSSIPDHFVLPARFAVARTVYGRVTPAGVKEAVIWEDLVKRSTAVGSFTPLVSEVELFWHAKRETLVESARAQRYAYLLLIQMHPETGSADITLLHTGSGGVMATAQAVADNAGRRGFWGGRIRNDRRLNRVTLKIAKATAPVVEEMLRGVAERQR